MHDIHVKIRDVKQKKRMRITQSGKNCAKNAPSRARAWFENKRFDWLSVNFFVHWPVRMLALLPFFAFNYVELCWKNCIVLSQSESSNFFMHIIRWLIPSPGYEKGDNSPSRDSDLPTLWLYVQQGWQWWFLCSSKNIRFVKKDTN